MKHFLFALLVIFASQQTLATDEPQKTPALHQESLYQILAAEFAIYRHQFDQALSFYLQQARATKAPYIAERATRLAMYKKRYVDMLEAALIWQQGDDGDSHAHFFTSLAYAFNMQPAAALEHMRTVLRRDSETDFTRLVNLMPSGHQSESFYLNELFQALDQYPQSYDLALSLAILHNRRGNTEQSLQYADKAVELAIQNPAVIDYSTRLYLTHDQPQKALDVYRKAISKNPKDLHLRHTLAQIAIHHDLEEAEKQLKYLMGHSQDESIMINLALVYMQQEQYDKARPLLELLISQQKRISSANYYLGLIHQRQGDLDNAMAAFMAVSEPGQRKLAQEQIIRLYIEQSLYREAMSRINTNFNKTSDEQHRKELLILKARVHERQGDTDSAYQILTQLLQNDPDSIELRYNRAMLSAENGSRIAQVESDLRHIIDIQPDSALALNALGYTLANKTDRYREALQLIERAHKLLPDDPAILDSLGWVLYRLGRKEEALSHLQKAMEKYPDPEIAAHLGEVLWKLDRKDEARNVLREALEKSPDHRVLNETIKRLNVSF